MAYISKNIDLITKEVNVKIKDDYNYNKSLYVNKIVEIEYMIEVIEKSEFKKMHNYYNAFNLTDLKKVLATRLTDFAASETHRDYQCMYGE